MRNKFWMLALLPLLVVSGCYDDPEPAPVIHPIVTIEMQDGKIMIIELFPEFAPNTVANFIELAESGFYDGLTFHRVIPGFMIQGGCPQGTGQGNPGYFIPGEFSDNDFENDLDHDWGTISMARGGHDYNSAGSQFFITVGKTPWLNGKHAAFGRIISGMEVAEDISLVPKTGEELGNKPLEPQRIERVTVDTFGYKFDKAKKIRR